MIEIAGFTVIEPKMLIFAALIPFFILFTWIGTKTRAKAMRKFCDAKLFQVLNPNLVTRGKNSLIRQLLFIVAVLLIVLGIARPGGQPEFIDVEIGKKGLDIMLMVDLSSSMRAIDLQPDRLTATKEALKQFIDSVEDDRIGLTVFAGSASLQAPLTQDYRTAKMMVDILSTNFLPIDGTAIGDSLDVAIDKISEERRKGAIIIMLTDGENTKGKKPNEAIERAKKEGVIVYTIGIGTKEGAQIPDGKDENGNLKYKIYQGKPVVTRLDEDLLKTIAKQTGGKHFSAESSQALMQVYSEISRLTKKEVTEKKKKAVYKEFYIWTVLPALLFLLLDVFMGRKSAWFPRKNKTVSLPS